MDLTRYVVLDCCSGTFFNASHAVLIDTDKLSSEQLDLLDNGSDFDRADLAEEVGIDLETWAPPEARAAAQVLDAVATLLNAEQWSSDHLNAVADMVRTTGRVINDV